MSANVHHASDNKTLFGFWVYIMTDCVLFATLFATYIVLSKNTYGGESAGELFSLPFVLGETLLLLTSSFTCGLALLATHRGSARVAARLLVITMLLGLTFLGMEIFEFNQLASEGNDWQRSGFLSAFFTLVGTHGLHITAGLTWMGIIVRQLMTKGVTRHVLRRTMMLSLFWHFLDIVWIFIFTIVYLIGAINA